MSQTIELTDTPHDAAHDRSAELLTFLFADVRGYTRFTQENGDKAAARLVSKFAHLLRENITPRGGRLIELRGDEALMVFGSARQALRAAVDLQEGFARESALDPSLPLHVGMGLDAGEAVPFEEGYRGEALNLAARLCNLAGTGEILASEGLVYLGRRVDGLSFAERGLVPIKGFANPVRVIGVLSALEASGDASDRTQPSVTSGSMPGDLHLPIGGFLGALPSGVMVGRDGEWERVMTALDAVSKGNGRLVLLSGEPGIGKTRLAQEVTLKARHWGFVVATGRCYEQEQVPYYPFLEALVTIYNACPAEIREEMPRLWPYLARLLPDQIAVKPETSFEGQEDQQRLFQAVTRMLEAIATIMPVAILLDDLHWADDSSIKLLQHLTRYTRGSRVLLLGTYRDVALHRQHPLEAAVSDLSREQLVEEVEIKRLGLEGTRDLMTEIMGDHEGLAELAELVYRRTDGNAFFIQEMLRVLIERGDVYRSDNHWHLRKVREMEVPKSVRSLIGQRLGQLGERAQEILRESSVLGHTFTFDDLLALGRHIAVPRHASDDVTAFEIETAGWREDEIEDSLEQAIQAGLVREAGRDGYAFNHAITQEALYEELSTRRRKRLHLAAGKSLERLSESLRQRRAAELTWHFLEGDDAQQALPYALLAGDAAEEVFANDEAERHYRAAIELADELGDRSRDAEAREKLGNVLAIAARYDNALELLEVAAAYYQSRGELEAEGRVVAQIGHVHYLRDTPKEGIARLSPLIQTREELPGECPPTYALAALYAALARLYIDQNMNREQLRAAERAIELAKAIAATTLLNSAEITRADALWRLGRDDEAIQAMEEVIPRAENSGDLSNLARALHYSAEHYAQRGEADKELRDLERALEVSERRGDRGQIVAGSMKISSHAYVVGDWKQARLYLDRAEAIIRSLESTRLAHWPAIARGWLALREGDLDAAVACGEQSLSLTLSTHSPEWHLSARRLLAEVHLQREDPEAAAQILEPARHSSAHSDSGGFLRTMAWVCLELGERDEAQDLAAQSSKIASDQKELSLLVESLVVQGMVMTRQASWEQAERIFDIALSASKHLPFPYGEARTLHEYGSMRAQAGDTRAARKHLKRSLSLFERLGAKHEAERVRRTQNLLAGQPSR